MVILAVGLILFLGSHLLPGTRLKDELTARFGERGYKMIFALASGLGFALTLYGYHAAREAGPMILYDPPFWLRHVTMGLMLIAIILLVATYIPGRIRLYVRHPMVTAVLIWAFAHLLANGDSASVILFAAFLAWAILDRISLKRRETAGLVTVTGGPWRNDLLAVGVGVLLYAAIVLRLHAWLIGVPVM